MTDDMFIADPPSTYKTKSYPIRYLLPTNQKTMHSLRVRRQPRDMQNLMPELKAAIESVMSGQATALLCAVGFLLLLGAVLLVIDLKVKRSRLANRYVARPHTMQRGDPARNTGFDERLPDSNRKRTANE